MAISTLVPREGLLFICTRGAFSASARAPSEPAVLRTCHWHVLESASNPNTQLRKKHHQKVLHFPWLPIVEQFRTLNWSEWKYELANLETLTAI